LQWYWWLNKRYHPPSYLRTHAQHSTYYEFISWIKKKGWIRWSKLSDWFVNNHNHMIKHILSKRKEKGHHWWSN
jgi:hypothetical protein